MKEIFIPIKEFESLSSQVDKIETLLRVHINNTPKSLSEQWLNVKETCKVLNVTPRTLQTYRDKRLIPFTQHQSKILFKASDIQDFLESNIKK